MYQCACKSFLLLMTGKASSSRPVVLLEGNRSMQDCRAVFNGLIALGKAASGNAVILCACVCGDHLEKLSATRESQRISLMAGERSCVGCQILSILHIARVLFLSVSIPLPPPPLSFLHSIRQLHCESDHKLPT